MPEVDPRLLEALKALIEVVDNCDYALDGLMDHPQSAYRHGLMLIRRSALQRAHALGLEDYTVLDGRFDPRYHEAVSLEPGGVHGDIQRVLRRGWTFDGKTLRHSQVVVYQGGTHAPEVEDDEDDPLGGRRRLR